MSAGLERTCPECGMEQTFYLAASMELHLGEKSKWYCPECGFGLVKIGEEIDSAVSA